MPQLQNSGNAQGLPGRILTTPLYATFAEGITIPTAEGTRLICRTPGQHDPADSPPSVSVTCLAAVAPVPNRTAADEPEVFALTTAIMDADGTLWQRTRTISVVEIWRAMLLQPVFYRVFDRPSEDPLLRNAQSVSRRVLVKPVETLCDMRDDCLVEVIRERERKPGMAVDPTLLYQNPERLLFRFRFKYFGAALGLTEERAAFRIASTNQLVYNNYFIITLHPKTDAELIVALNNNDAILSTKGVRLSDLGLLCSRDVHLKPGWDLPSWELARVADLPAWQQAFRDAGVDPSTIEAFKPNPAIRYGPAAFNP